MKDPEFGKHGGGGAKKIGQEWLITFADLSALLLTFFVLLFSMSTVNSETWESIVDSLKQQLNPSKSGVGQSTGERNQVTRIVIPQSTDLDYLNTLIVGKISAHPLLSRAILTRLDDGLVISLPSDALFETGSATLTEAAGEAAGLLVEVLDLVGNRIDIHGHSDPKPIDGGEFVSNWELSLGRALSLATVLLGAGLDKDIAAFGFADSRYADISEGFTEEQRLSLGRRVDVVIREGVDGADSDAP
jgi:chemotaxis protein MotB